MNEPELTLDAPAKVNLDLKVLRRRSDGFHEIETRMAPISLCDELSFKRGSTLGLEFTCDDERLPTDETNLVVKAVRLLEKRARRKFDVAIHLKKRIPHGAGLGGGSSDAAMTFRGLCQLFELKIGDKKLRKIAAEIGSDIPFFLSPVVSDCRGRGEVVEPVVDFPHRLPLLLVKPAFEIPTPWAYQNWQDSKELPGVLYAPQICAWGAMVNDLERPVFAKHFVLADLKSWLRDQPEVSAALMSGSGSTMMAVLREFRLGQQLLERVKAEFGESTWTHVCEAG
ncbi:MAG: 4-diphosphocytidyl-2-C-methyl-D-erythritol kinase [Verrucomicrobiales bacterium]|jgi:4-diphosphocytidyl-2-C-methyl-D-erythritol kinase